MINPPFPRVMSAAHHHQSPNDGSGRGRRGGGGDRGGSGSGSYGGGSGCDGSGGGIAYLDVIMRRESIHLIEKLQHRPLHLAISRELGIEPLGADGIEFVNEDDRGLWRVSHKFQVGRAGGGARTLENGHSHPPAGCATHHTQFRKEHHLLLLREGERVAHELRAVADEHLDQLRARELEEARVRLRGTRASRSARARSLIRDRI